MLKRIIAIGLERDNSKEKWKEDNKEQRRITYYNQENSRRSPYDMEKRDQFDEPSRKSQNKGNRSALRSSYERSIDIQNNRSRRRDINYEGAKYFDAGNNEVSYMDNELMGVSEQVPFNAFSSMFNSANYQPMIYPFGMQQPYPNPMAGISPGYMNPMMTMSYSIPNNIPPYIPSNQQNSPGNDNNESIEKSKRNYPDFGQNEKMIEEIKKLQEELKEANEKIIHLEEVNNNNESHIKE